MKDSRQKIFGRLTIIKYSHCSKGHYFWLCKCHCGNEKILDKGNLVSGNTKSCGCLLSETSRSQGKKNKTHGMSKKSIYNIWRSMRKRCLVKSTTMYRYYGGRGIKICKRWDIFENFYKDMGDRPKGLTIDRINNNKNYTPNNCRWATELEQHNNTSANIIVTFDGIKRSIAEWCRIKKINSNLVYYRKNKGMSPKNAILFVERFT